MIIRLQDVTWVREGRPVLNRINWQVKKGEHWAVLGLNGSGKTTLLNMINGYIWPTSGSISVLGQTFGRCELRELRKAIGWVSSSLLERLYAGETGREIVLSGKYASIGLYEHPEREDIDRAELLLEQLGCGHLAQQPYGTMSQGEKQRLLITRALVNSPRLLILDEPCYGLDILAREQLLQIIAELGEQRDAPSLIYVTHHPEEILPVFRQTLLLRRGEVYAAGCTAELLTSAAFSDFLGVPVEISWTGGRAAVRIAR